MKDDDHISFFTGVGISDLGGILIALFLSVGLFYLIFRMLFGAPLFDAAIQAEERATEPPPIQDQVHTGPGEVGVTISPAKPAQTPPQTPAKP